MIFDLEIAFTGLCLFTFKGEDPCRPDKCTVYLVDATGDYPHAGDLECDALPHEHKPRLVVPSDHLRTLGQEEPDPDELIPGPDGEDHALWRLKGANIKLKPHEGEGHPLLVPKNRRRGGYTYPPDEPSCDPSWFDWLPDLREIDCRLGALRDDLNPSENGPAIAMIQFTTGILETMELAHQQGEWMKFVFQQVNGQGPVSPRRCLADRTVLRFKGLRHPLKVRLERRCQKCQYFGIGPGSLYTPGRPTLGASITNLDKDHNQARPLIFDFLWLYELFCWKDDDEPPASERYVPKVLGYKYAGRTPSTGTCPPGEG